MSFKKLQNKSVSTKRNTTSYEGNNFEAFFNANWSRVYGVVYRIIGDPAQAQDLALESFLQLHQSPPRHGTNLNGWIYRVATNLAFNALRAKNRRANYEAEAGAAVLERKTFSTPDDEAERSEERQMVREILARMKKRAAKILILRHTGFSYAEIADTVGVATSSVGTLLARAEREFERRYRERLNMDD